MMHQGLFDTHCHLLDKNHELTPEEIIADAHKSNVMRLVNVCCSLAEAEAIINLSSCNQEKGVYSSIGIHPNYADSHLLSEDFYKKILFYAKNNNVVAIGECGLDYYHTQDKKQIELQKQLFILQIKIANSLAKPLIIHCRDAFDDCYYLLNKYLNKSHAGIVSPGVMHCFTGTLSDAEKFIELGFFISFAGNVTFKNAPQLQEICRKISLKNIVIETDSPYLAPEPYRGKINLPSYVAITANKVAQLKNINYQDLVRIVESNSVRLFRV